MEHYCNSCGVWAALDSITKRCKICIGRWADEVRLSLR